jgi:dTDP-glucose pyrophosphorylase/predicted transcriptional regulator
MQKGGVVVFLNVPIEQLLVSPEASLRAVIATIQQGMKQIALVVDADRRLLGTITDGDVRRAILHNTSLDAMAAEVMQQSFMAGHPDMSHVELIDLMSTHTLRHVPLIDEQGVVVDLAWISDLLSQKARPDLLAVIMAGGFGKRLRPLTEDLPKPMLPVGDRPLMEWIVAQLCKVGIHRMHVTTHYKPDKIKEHFGNGQAFGVELNYLHEGHPLGTGGALGLMPVPEETMLVINGDILTRVDFQAMRDYHHEHQAMMTLAVRPYSFQVPYGVVENDGPYVQQVREKPHMTALVNAGIYMLEPEVYNYIPVGQRFDMTELIQWLLDDGQTIVSFPIHEYWLDIGQHADYVQAQQDVAQEYSSA